MEFKHLINEKKKLIKKFDDALKFAVYDINCSFDDIKEIKKRRDDLIDELVALSNNSNIRKS